MKNKLKQNNGFSLAEMLMTLIILALTFSVISGGIIVVKDSYEKITLKAESQTLISTAITAITTDLKSATDIRKETRDGKEAWVFNSESRGYNMYYDNDDTQGIMVCTVNSTAKIPLLTSKTNSSGLTAKIDSIDFKDGYFKLEISTQRNGAQYGDIQEIYIRPFSN